MAKRIVTVFLALVLVLSVIPAVHAQTVGEPATYVQTKAVSAATPTFAVEDAWASDNSTVEVHISVTNNPGLLGATLTVAWPEELTLVAAKSAEAFEDLTYQKPSNFVSTGTNFVWYGTSVENVTDGTVLILTFHVAEGVEEDSKLLITVTGNGIYDLNKDAVAARFEKGGIRIVNYTPGDVDDNGVIDTGDLILLAQYISDNCITDPNGYNVTLNVNAANVNDDDRLDTLDLILIGQYLSDGCVTDPEGYNVILKPVTPKCGHSNMAATEAKAATCTENGNIAYWYCAQCETYFKDAAGTDSVELSDTVIPSPGHEEVIDEAVAPTYTSTGLTEGSHCEVCGEVFAAQEVIPMLQAKHHSITYRNLNGASAPEPSSYAEHIGLDELPVPEAPGYTFKGWYTASEGGTVVDYIPAGSTQDYILYARWELITYNIRYFEAPQNENVTTYTVEDEIYLNDPNWSGLRFIGWTEANGKVQTETRNGNVYYKIAEGTTGNLDLTANWKLMRNIATPGTNALMLGRFNEKAENGEGQYVFIFELGTIEHVVLEELNQNTPGLFNHTGAGDFTLTVENSLEMGEEVAESIAKTISKSVATSEEWETSKEWAHEKSKEHSSETSVGLELGNDEHFVHVSIEQSYGYTASNTESWGQSETKGGSYGEEVENGEEVANSLAYQKTMSTTTSTSITISGDSPHGYYDYVNAGNIRVFGVVTYNLKDGNYYLNTYSILDNMHSMVVYYPDINSLNHPTCETLEYKAPLDKIDEAISKLYFVEYMPNGTKLVDGEQIPVQVDGQMMKTLHTVGGEEKLEENGFTREGYIFMGWEERYEGEEYEGTDLFGTTKSTYTDGQVVQNIADQGETVTLYAQWTPIDYTVEYQGVKPNGASTQINNVPDATSHKYDESLTLPAAPTLPGYTFGGWYLDSACTQKAGDAGQFLKEANLASTQGAVVKLYPKWTANTYTVTFDLDGGSCGETSREVIFDQLYVNLKNLPVPTKTDHLFLGWTLNGVAVDDITYVRTVGDHTLKANWLSLKWSETRGDGKNKRFRMITDSDNYWTDFAEEWNPNIDKNLLEAHGYTGVIIEISFWVNELDQGNQRVYFATPGGKEICKWSFTSTPSDWHEYTRSTANESTRYVNISNFGDTMNFKTIWEAYGNGGDSWDLGGTTITLQFVKG